MIRAVKLDPTGNITYLVTSKPTGADETAITRTLMAECEQVAYLEAPTLPGAQARIRLMGGEFCGNAAMAAACWLAQKDGIADGEERTVLLEVSGAAGVLACAVKRKKDAFEGTVPMPGIESEQFLRESGRGLIVIRMQGILHLILENDTLLEKDSAEALLRRLAETMPAEAVGLLQWNRKMGYMTPLVYVRGSGTMVWETGCGSGSAAVGAWEAMRRGNGRHEIEIRQPGGLIRVIAEVRDGWAEKVWIRGNVRIGTEEKKEVG